MAQHTCQVCGTVYDTAADCCPTCGNPLAMDICPEVPEAPTPPETPEIPEVPENPAEPRGTRRRQVLAASTAQLMLPLL